MSHRSKSRPGVRSGTRSARRPPRPSAPSREIAAAPPSSWLPAYAGEPLPEDASQQALVSAVQSGREEACLRYLAEEPSLQGLKRLLGETAAVWDRLLSELAFEPPMACGPGCDACCYNPISLTPAEALFLGLEMLDRFTPGETARVERGTAQVLSFMSGKSRPELALIRHLLPCPLLYEGSCMVHRSRPLVCRGWNAVRPEECRRSLTDHDPQALIENHPLPRLLADHIQLGLLNGTHALGLEAGYLALPRALALLQEHGVEACALDWLAGRPFFGRKHQW